VAAARLFPFRNTGQRPVFWGGRRPAQTAAGQGQLPGRRVPVPECGP